VIGDNPFADKLERVLAKTLIQKREVKIKYISKVNENLGTHILFVSKSFEDKLPTLFAVSSGILRLIIGDTHGYTNAGVMLNMTSSDGKLYFEINHTSIKESGLKIDSLLLSYAIKVYNGEGG